MTQEVTNGQIDSAHYGPIGDAARNIASYCEGAARSHVYTTAFNALTAAHTEAAELKAWRDAVESRETDHIDEIEALKAENERLRDVLTLFAEGRASPKHARQALGGVS